MMRRKLSQAEWAVIGLTALLLALMVGWRLGADSVRQLTAQAAALWESGVEGPAVALVYP